MRSIAFGFVISLSFLLFVGAGCDRTVAVFVRPPPRAPTSSATTPEKLEGEKKIYLTFDADMTAGMRKRLEKGEVAAWYDPEIIKYLKVHGIPYTVFMTGMFAEVYPNLAKELGSDPNVAIGNHSYDHAGFESPCYGLRIVKTDAEKIEEIRKTQEILRGLTGRTPALFRYPGLCRNAPDDRLVERLGLIVNDGDIVSGDAFDHDAAKIIRNVEAEARPGGVVLMHLGGPNAPAVADALKVLVPKLQEEGYAFARL